MNKFVKTGLLAGTIVLGMSSIAMAKFDDVDEKNHYFEPITILSEKGIINGYPDNTFKPANKVTRAEFAKMISVAEKLTINEKNRKTFGDVSNHWAKEYIEIIASNDLIKGYEDNTYRAQNEITYGEVVTILLRILGADEVANDNTNWPENCMDYASEIGLLKGVATNDLIGINPARRDNVALMICNKIEIEETLGNIEDSEDKVSGENVPENDDSNKDLENKVDEEITNNDTKKLYIGSVEKVYERRGENYIIVKEFNGVEREIKVSSSATLPKQNTLLVYKLSSKGDVRLKKKLTFEDIDKNYLYVEETDKELVKIKGQEKWMDLEMDYYVFNGEKIELDEYTYYLVEMEENKDNVYEFNNAIVQEKKEIKLEEEDRMIFDKETELAFIIRGIEE